MRLETRRRRRAGMIGLAPLIDVVFILLLFFLLSTQFDARRGMALRVPTVAASVEPTDDRALTLSLENDGDVRIDGGDSVTPAALEDHPIVRDALASRRPVRVRGGTSVSLQSLVSLMDRLKAIGFDAATLGRPR